MPVIPHVYKWPIHGIDTPSQSRNIYRQVIFFKQANRCKQYPNINQTLYLKLNSSLNIKYCTVVKAPLLY